MINRIILILDIYIVTCVFFSVFYVKESFLRKCSARKCHPSLVLDMSKIISHLIIQISNPTVLFY